MKSTARPWTIPFFLFAGATLLMGLYAGLYEPSFNNYLAQIHSVSEVARGGLEFPRELPGFLVVFLFAALIFMADTRLAALSALLVAISLLGLGFFAPNLPMVILWMLVWSTGAHLFMTISHSIALRLAPQGEEGRVLGKLGAMESLGTLLGMVLVYWGVSRLNFSFTVIFTLASLFALIACILLYKIKAEPVISQPKLVFKQRYLLFYFFNICFGARKQIFLTFAPWVLIKLFNFGIESFAMLGIIATIINLGFRPLLGKAIDAWGEKIIIASDSICLFIICLLYALAPRHLPPQTAVIIIMTCFIIDQLLFSVRIARTTYLNKILEKKEDLSPTLSMGVTLDHAVSMLVPMGGGLLWANCGFSSVFFAAAFIAVLNFAASLYMPAKTTVLTQEVNL